MTIDFKYVISVGLRELISLQNNLKNVTLRSHHCYKDNEMKDMKDIIPLLIKSSLTLTKLTLIEYYIPLSFIANFTNLQELILDLDSFNDFNQLQYANFLQLKVLKFMHLIPKIEMLIKFLEINGKNLTEFCINRFRGNVDLINLV